MTLRSYIKGRNIEYKVKKWLEEKGYYCIRSAGSHGIIDLFCGNGKKLLAIQVKTSLSQIKQEELKKLRAAAEKLKAKPVIIDKELNMLDVKL